MLPMMKPGCYNCPALKGCTATYRGSTCAANRVAVGIDADPLTNADWIRSADDEQIADFLYSVAAGVAKTTAERLGVSGFTPPDLHKEYVEWLRKPYQGKK